MWDFLKSACCMASVLVIFVAPYLPSIIDAIKGNKSEE